MTIERDRIAALVGAIVALVLQIVVAPVISIAGAVPNVIAAYVVALSIARPSRPPLVMAFVMGLLYSFVAGGPVGGMALLLVLVAFLASRAFTVLANDALFMPIAIIAVSSVVIELLYAMLLIALGLDVGIFEAIVLRVLPCALYDCVVGVIFFPIMLKFVVGSAPSGRPLETTLR